MRMVDDMMICATSWNGLEGTSSRFGGDTRGYEVLKKKVVPFPL
jgi:hypothetical protein